MDSRFDVFTLGFSNRAWEETVSLIQGYRIQQLIDIRTLPGSKHTPQFNLENLQHELPKAGIDYIHMKSLGGLRKPARDLTTNAAWRNDGFRAYADYMQTDAFEQALAELVRLLKEKATV